MKYVRVPPIPPQHTILNHLSLYSPNSRSPRDVIWWGNIYSTQQKHPVSLFHLQASLVQLSAGCPLGLRRHDTLIQNDLLAVFGNTDNSVSNAMLQIILSYFMSFKTVLQSSLTKRNYPSAAAHIVCSADVMLQNFLEDQDDFTTWCEPEIKALTGIQDRGGLCIVNT